MKIKKQFLTFLLSTLFFQLTSTTNKTFFMPRPIQQDAVMQNAMSQEFNNAMAMEYEKDSENNGGFILIGNLFYEQSTDKNDIAKYFSINNKTELVVAGRAITTPKDIASEWLKIIEWGGNTLEDNFQSKISLSPEQKTFGLNLQANKVLNLISNKLWLSLSIPFIQKETDLNLQEYNIQNEPDKAPFDLPGEDVQNAAMFFKSVNLTYAKMKDGVQKLTGLADINIKLNYFVKNKKTWTLSVYPQLTIPTGYKPRAEYIFEPIIGNARHWAIGAGTNFEIELFDNNDHLLSFLAKLDYNYLFENAEKRTLDLKNNPWSRYLRLTDEDEKAEDIQAANLFTQDLNVKPKSHLNLLLTLHYDNNDFLNLEIGYNFWWKAKESVSLKNTWDKKVGITQIKTTNEPEGTHSKSKATIADNPVDNDKQDGVFTTIKQDDLDLNSATHPSTISNKIYLSGGVEGSWKQNIYQTNLGAAYEFAGNKALSAWSVWLQTSLYI